MSAQHSLCTDDAYEPLGGVMNAAEYFVSQIFYANVCLSRNAVANVCLAASTLYMYVYFFESVQHDVFGTINFL